MCIRDSGGGQLIDQACNAQIIVADDLLFGVEHLAHFHGDLCFLKGGSQILHVGDGGADAHHSLDVMLAGQGIHDAGSQLFHIGAVDALADLLDQYGIRLADIEHKVLLLVGEQAADHIVGGDIAAAGNTHDEHHAGNIGGKRCV